MENMLPSAFALKEEVEFVLGESSFPAYVRGIQFDYLGDVAYDLEVYYDAPKSLHTGLDNVHYAMIRKATKQQSAGGAHPVFDQLLDAIRP